MAQGLDTGALMARSTMVGANFVNNTGVANEYDLGVGILTADGKIESLSYLTTSEALAAGGSVKGQWFDVERKLAAREGTHVLVPISSVVDTEVWHLSMKPTETHVEASVVGGKVSLSLRRNKAVDYAMVRAQMMVEQPTWLVGQSQTIKAVVSNTGTKAYAGEVYLTSSDGSLLRPLQAAVTLAPGQQQELRFAFAPSAAGEVVLKLSVDKAQANLVGWHAVAVEEADPTSIDSHALWQEERPSQVYDLQGRRVGAEVIRSATASRAGSIYIVQGKKVAVGR